MMFKLMDCLSGQALDWHDRGHRLGIAKGGAPQELSLASHDQEALERKTHVKQSNK